MKPENLITLKLEPKMRTKQELAETLQISYTTFWRRLKEREISRGRQLLDCQRQSAIAEVFGYRLNFNA